MPNHFVDVTGAHYFPGMLTMALLVIPAVYALHRIWTTRLSLIRSLR